MRERTQVPDQPEASIHVECTGTTTRQFERRYKITGLLPPRTTATGNIFTQQPYAAI